MGIEIYHARFLPSKKRRGVCLERTLILGHQELKVDDNEYRALTESIGIPCQKAKYAGDLFQGWGVAKLDVTDVSDFEGANILHDLNQPVDTRLHGVYDCVVDGGTLEHLFNSRWFSGNGLFKSCNNVGPRNRCNPRKQFP